MVKRFLIIFTLLWATVAQAAPTISSITGTMTHGAIGIAVSGAGFGTKAVAAPKVFENFDSNDSGRQNGDTIHGKTCSNYGAWLNATYRAIPTYTTANQRSANSTLSSYVHMVANNVASNAGHMYVQFAATHQPTVLVSWWMRLSASGITGSGNIKLTRIIDNSGQTGDNSAAWADAYSPPQAYCCIVSYDGDADPLQLWPSNGHATLNYTQPIDTWYQVIVMKKASSDGLSDGSERIYINGVELENTTVAPNWHNQQIGGTGNAWERMLFNDYIANYTAGDFYIQVDDVYIDTTWQSVWIGDAATWADCTHREVQIPTAWADDGITLTANQGSFDTLVGKYLYAMDNAGLVNSDGYPIPAAQGDPPTVYVTYPDIWTHKFVSGIGKLIANPFAATDTTISSIQFQVNGVAYGDPVAGNPLNGAPHTININWEAQSGWQFDITAVATQSDSQTATSAAVRVQKLTPIRW